MLPGNVVSNVETLIILLLTAGRVIRKKTEIPFSDKSGRSVRYKPENPCSHCGSKWHSIYVCTAYQ